MLTWWQGRTRLGHGDGRVRDPRPPLQRDRARARRQRLHGRPPRAPADAARHRLHVDLRAAQSRPARRRRQPRRARSSSRSCRRSTSPAAASCGSGTAPTTCPVSEGVTPPKETQAARLLPRQRGRRGPRRQPARQRPQHARDLQDRASAPADVIWRLGGERSDFAMGPGARFAFQHDVVRLADGTISLFDNEATPPRADQSRGLVLRLDSGARERRASCASTPTPTGCCRSPRATCRRCPTATSSSAGGPSAHVSELSARRAAAARPRGAARGADSYQAFRFPWHGEPLDRPALAARRRGPTSA